MSDPSLARRSAAELARLIASRAISPLEVVDAHLGVLERLNPKLNAVVTVNGAACEEARAAGERVARGDPLGVLHGLPVVIKDITPTAGVRTTYGSPLHRDHVPAEDAEVVRRLKRAGAIVLGKTNTPEFAAGANTVNPVFGATRNPWDPRLSPAGSSGGSAVAVATGMAPLAQGTDFGCSIRIPASFCGIVGLRTTPGLVPNEPMRLPWDAGQVHGPLARTAEDAALMLDAMTGLDPYWPLSAAPPWKSAHAAVADATDAAGLKVAYVRDIAGIGVDGEVSELCRRAAFRLRDAGARVEEVELDASDGFAAYKVLRGQWMVGQQVDHLDDLDAFGPNLAGNVRDGLGATPRAVAEAERVRETVWGRFRDALTRFDYVLTPASPVPPYPVDENFPAMVGGRRLANYIDWIAPCFLVTFVGFPAGSAPAGLTAAGLPVGVQIVGRRFDEPGILSVAKLVQATSMVGWPPLSA